MVLQNYQNYHKIHLQKQSTIPFLYTSIVFNICGILLHLSSKFKDTPSLMHFCLCTISPELLCRLTHETSMGGPDLVCGNNEYRNLSLSIFLGGEHGEMSVLLSFSHLLR